MDFKTGRELLELCKEHEMSISEVMMQRETDLTEVSRDDIYAVSYTHLDVYKRQA